MAKNLKNLSEEGKLEVKMIMERKMSDPSYIKQDRYTGCLLWRGAVSGGSAAWGRGEYSAINFRSSSGLFKPFQVGGHIVQLFLKTGQIPSPPLTGVSHLCHKKLCLNSGHLILESIQRNNSRKACNGKPGQKRECRDKSHSPQCFSETTI